MKIIALGGPKGGVGKSTSAVTIAAVAASDGMRVLLIDCDQNRTALDWVEQAGDAIPVEAVDGRDLIALRRLRNIDGYDLAVVDLPGAREGTFAAVLRGEDGRPVVDLFVAPTAPEVVELRPTIRAITGEILPLGLPHMLVFSRVLTASLLRAEERRQELRTAGITVADTILRRYLIFDEAAELGRTVLDIGGTHSYARSAEHDYRALTAEVLAAVGMVGVTR